MNGKKMEICSVWKFLADYQDPFGNVMKTFSAFFTEIV